MNTNTNGRSLLIIVLFIQCVAILSVAKEFDFFYFVQQWPASYCDSRRGCCYPKTGKPAEDFSIHGLWPNYVDGTYPSNCDSSNPFDDSKVSNLESVLEKEWPTLACPSGDGLKFWRHEWEKHGTCAESIFDESGYFEAALSLKKKANLLHALANAGIKPADGKFHTMGQIKDAITKAVGYAPFIECNVDSKGNHQVYQVYQCVDASGSKFIECPVMPHGRPCGNKIELPSFSSASSRDEL
ncbi:intracellular ribonuclease LX [Artemisia annua]|uniref:Intracellular ribonuclease LX n=1 Tax=Artemisia annua TaxID=35608 RepID=A0A2U1NX65_ARTAN|nr:intracellular ribonuclease LX [Artemisia annua]